MCGPAHPSEEAIDFRTKNEHKGIIIEIQERVMLRSVFADLIEIAALGSFLTMIAIMAHMTAA
jgi:hypothetical protein